MNILTYTLQLTDRMSSTLSRIGASTGSTTQDVRELKGEVQSLNNVNLNGFFSTMKKVSAFLGIGALFGKSIKDGMEQGMKNVSFEVLFGGVDNAKNIIDQITVYASKAYGKAAVTNAVQMQAGFDIGQDEIMKNLKAIGDVAMGDVNKFNSLNLAFSQMSSTGKLMGQDLLQMINAGFNPLVQMSKTTGKSVAALKDEMSKGLITAQMVKQAFYDASGAGGQFNGMVDRMANETGGLWSAAMSKINERLLQFYNWIEPVLKPALRQFNNLLADPIGTIGQLTDKITTNFPIITGVILTATAAVVGYKLAILSLAGVQAIIAGLKSALVAYEIVVFAVKNATSLWAAAQWLLNVALNANPVGLIIAGVVALIALIAFLIIKIDGWGEAWKHTVNGAKLIFLAYVEYVKSSFNTVVQGIMIGINKIKEGWYQFKEAVGIGDSSENQKMLAQIQADTEARKKSIVDGYKKTAELAKQAGQEFKNAAGSFSWNDTSFSDVANGIKNKLGISAPGVPGTNGSGVAGTNGLMGGGGTGSNAGKETANSISTGGSKTTHITINLGELVGTININKNGFRESAENMRDIVLDEMTRVLSMAQGQTI